MSAFIASTTVTVLRGSLAPDEYGDERASMTSIASGVPALITEGVSRNAASAQRSYQPSEMRDGVVEEFTIRLRPDAPVTEDDRLADERTGAVYQIRSIYQPQSVVGLADARALAVRTGAASLPVNG